MQAPPDPAGPRQSPTLLIMAAGIGARFGGLKQLQPIGPGGEAIFDYSVYEALSAGFGRVVLIVRPETQALFERHVAVGMARHTIVTYVSQTLEHGLPPETPAPARTRPWGTGHAVLCASGAIHGPFAVINADDLYGAEAYRDMAGVLRETSDAAPATFCMMAYPLADTLPRDGGVSRAVCRADADGWLTHIEEHRHVERRGGMIASINDVDTAISLDPKALVSMNMWGLCPRVFPMLRDGFAAFATRHSAAASQPEYHLPAAMGSFIRGNTARVRVLTARAAWHGMTHPGDYHAVAAHVGRLRDAGRYPRTLWT